MTDTNNATDDDSEDSRAHSHRSDQSHWGGIRRPSHTKPMFLGGAEGVGGWVGGGGPGRWPLGKTTYFVKITYYIKEKYLFGKVCFGVCLLIPLWVLLKFFASLDTLGLSW